MAVTGVMTYDDGSILYILCYYSLLTTVYYPRFYLLHLIIEHYTHGINYINW